MQDGMLRLRASKAWMPAVLIDGKHVINSNDPKQLARLEEVVNIKEDPIGQQLFSIENNDQLRKRLRGRLIITDDKMGAEWRCVQLRPVLRRVAHPKPIGFALGERLVRFRCWLEDDAVVRIVEITVISRVDRLTYRS